MIVIPAVDLREGACVQLVGGDYAAERVRRDDPVAQLRAFRADGFTTVHVVDLDAATGRGDNAAVVERLLAEGGDIQVGGGVRSVERAAALVSAGASRVVAGTRVVADPAFRAELCAALPGRVVVALDVGGREVLVKGWAEGSGVFVGDLLDELDGLPLASVLMTAVHREGRMGGLDLDLLREMAVRTRHPIVASGGVGSIDDLRAAQIAGAAAVVVGMALYQGSLDAKAVAKEFREW
jgi:phosphoribosylformimino-5-aminoimidazole carboxamide ribotide isomerase